MEELKLPEHFEEYTEGRKAGFLKMKAAKEAGKMNCTPFVRQYGILSNKWGDFYAKGSTK